jgi:hypothetical protein
MSWTLFFQLVLLVGWVTFCLGILMSMWLSADSDY